jgi:hypothetical protein
MPVYIEIDRIMASKGRDIYMRDPDDRNYVDGVLETSDVQEQLIAQIKMMLFTNRGEVMGAPDFGASLEEHLFTMKFNAASMRSLLRDQTDKFIPMAAANKYAVDYSIKLVGGQTERMVLIDVKINGRPSFGVGIK